jgi:hypothetical protein
VKITHSAMFLSAIKAFCRGERPGPAVPVARIDLEGEHWTATGACGYFTDRENGQRYRLSVEPVRS